MKNIVFILTGDLQSSIDWVIFPEVVFLFPKKVGFNYAFFQSYYNISIEHSQPSIHAAVLYIFVMLKFAITLFSQRTFFQFVLEYQSRWKKLLIAAAVFSEQNHLNWNERSHLK